MHSIEEKTSLYKCYFCKLNIGRTEIEEHFETIHMFESSDHICNLCDKKFDTQNELMKHIESVQPTTNFEDTCQHSS